MAKIKTKYVCQECGYETSKWLGKCPECMKWNTLVEEIEQKGFEVKMYLLLINLHQDLLNINSIETKEEERFSTCINELDRVLRGRNCKRFISTSRWRPWNRKINTFNSSIK